MNTNAADHPVFLSLSRLFEPALRGLNEAGDWIAHSSLRLLLAWEFWESGVEKFTGSNWFHEIREDFPPPFSLLPSELSWQLATWSELLGALCLAIGLATRFWAVSLIIVTAVAWSAVHAGHGYNVCDNGWKLPLIYVAMLIPLILRGPGRLSIDHLVARRMRSGV